MSVWEAIGDGLAEVTGEQGTAVPLGAVGGGCINQAVRLNYGGKTYFVKLNSAAGSPPPPSARSSSTSQADWPSAPWHRDSGTRRL